MICGRPDKVGESEIKILLAAQTEYGLTYGQMVTWLKRRGVSISKPGLIKALDRYKAMIDLEKEHFEKSVFNGGVK